MENIKLNFNGKTLHIELSDEADTSVMREIFKYKEYRCSDQVIKEAKNPIIDIGAHKGFFTLYAKTINPKAKIIALEPEPKNLKMFEHHMKENKIKGVKIIHGALAGKTEERLLEISENSHNHRLGKTGMKIQAYSLNDLMSQNKIDKISLLKMDIEGGEHEVFDNLTSEDFTRINTVIMEYHNVGGKTHRNLEEILRSNKFKVQIFPSQFDKKMGFLFAHK